MFHWAFDEASTLTVQGWGFWLAIAGMLLTVIGFWITLVQLARTKNATAAVSDEVRNIQFAVSKFNAVSETSRAETSLESARRHLKGCDWDQANDALEAFLKALHTLRELQVNEISSHYDGLENAMTHATKLCERLDTAGPNGLSKSETPKTLSTLRDHSLLITSVRVALDRSYISE